MEKSAQIKELATHTFKTANMTLLHTPKYRMSQILEFLYLPAGIFINPKLQRFTRVYMLSLYFGFGYSILGTLATIQDGRSHLMENFYCTFACFLVFVTLLAGRHHEPFLRFLQQEAFYYEETSKEFAFLTDATIQRRIPGISGTIFVLVFITFVAPLYAAIFTNADTDGFTVLIYPIWYPWRRDTMGKYLCSLTLQYMSSLAGHYLLVFCIGSFALATLFVDVRFSLLGRKILSIKVDISRKSSLLTQKEFVSVIREHQTLIKFTRKTISCFVITATLVITYASVSAIFLITLFLKTDISTILKLKLASSCILGILSLMICCYCGELLSNVNKKLQDAIYSSPWYTFSISFRKLIIPFMIQNQIQFDMKSYGLFKLSVSCIAKIFRLYYTCIQILINRINRF